MLRLPNTGLRTCGVTFIALFFTLEILDTQSGGVLGADCPLEWRAGEGRPGVTGDLPVWAVTAWDPDGGGPQSEVLIAGGGFTGAGNVSTFGIATWNGAEWLAMGNEGTPGANNQVFALSVYNGHVIAAGDFTTIDGVNANRIARWDGTAWHALGTGLNHSVRALAVYNGELYVGGFFTQAGGVPATGIARWNGTNWQAVGGGVGGASYAVLSFTNFDNKLIVGGGFTSAGGATARNIASWNGASWQPMDGGSGLGSVEAIAVHGGQLIAAANFNFGPMNERFVRRWSGTTWTIMPNGPTDTVFAMTIYNGDLYAGGIFTNSGGVSLPNRLARWNGTNWSSVSSGPGDPYRRVRSLAVFNGDLIAGGLASKPDGNQSSQIGTFTGSSWRYMGGGFDAIVYDFETYHGELIAGGWFYTAGNSVANGIARRDNLGQWHSMGGLSGGNQFAYDLTVFEDSLIVSGSFTAIDSVPMPHGIARWDGRTWSAFGNAAVNKKLVHDGTMYGTGDFGPSQRVAQWDAKLQMWKPIGAFPSNSGVTCLTMFNGDLIAGGIGGAGVNESVWRWDFDSPGTWHPVGQHLGFTTVQVLGSFNGELLAGGYFNGGVLRFNGISWVPLAGGLFLGNEMPDEVLAVFDLRIYKSELIVAGAFSYAGAQQYSPEAVAAFHVARWNGSIWQGAGVGTNNAAVTLHEHNNTLIMGGWFDTANASPNGYWASWGPNCPADITGDGVVNVNDLLAVINAWGPCQMPCPADIAPPGGDGTVNVNDLLMVINNWG